MSNSNLNPTSFKYINQNDEDNTPLVPNLNNPREANLIEGKPQILTYNNIVESPEIVEPDEIVESIEIPENVNGGKFDPFCEIDILPLENADGFQSGARNVRVKRDTGQYLEAGIVSPKYLLIKNQNINEVCGVIRDKSELDWEHDRIFFDGKRYKNVYRTQSIQKKLNNGDVAYLMFTEINSYDQSSPAGWRIDFMIQVCKNGMLSARHGIHKSFSHTTSNVNWEQEILSASNTLKGERIIRRLDRFANNCDKLQAPLTMDALTDIRKNHINKLPALRYGEILDKFHNKPEYKDGRLWDLMQAGTNNLWHRDKITKAVFDNNAHFVDGMLDFGEKTHAGFHDVNNLARL